MSEVFEPRKPPCSSTLVNGLPAPRGARYKMLECVCGQHFGGGMQSPAESDVAVGKSDLENPGIEESSIEDIYEEMCNSIDSHVHTWSDLSDA